MSGPEVRAWRHQVPAEGHSIAPEATYHFCAQLTGAPEAVLRALDCSELHLRVAQCYATGAHVPHRQACTRSAVLTADTDVDHTAAFHAGLELSRRMLFGRSEIMSLVWIILSPSIRV